ncbi:ATP-binding protein [Streptomyces sp. NPDC047000]|uniref:ATP-binding protein n=1 Tax=Streptomyces sp. NPDC047000 TaxID=3155474 RepID=UPI0033F03FCB
MTAPVASRDRSLIRTVLPATLLTAVVAAAAVGWAVAAAPDSVRGPLGLGGAVGALALCAAVAAAAHGRAVAKAARGRLKAVSSEAERAVLEQERLAGQWRQEQQRIADAAAYERTRLLEDFARERARLAQEGGSEQARLAESVRQLSARLDRAVSDRAAAISATANAAARMQALATGMLADLRAMEERHSDEDVLADLLHLDHRTAQAGRLADSIAVLTGARSGRRWARPIQMESILRGAMGRISGYQRVRLHSVSDVAVAGHAAEGVMHALAELLDNAANFSPPSAEVHVYVEEVPAGVIVSVEDSGLVMGDVQLRRAERAVSGQGAELGGLTGTRLGLAVVGRLSHKYGLTVSFRPSARGGTGVLMLVPQEILTNAPASGAVPAPAPAAVSVRPQAAGPAGGGGSVSGASGRGAARQHPEYSPRSSAPVSGAAGTGGAEGTDEVIGGGLPKRSRGRTLAAAERARSAARSAERPSEATDGIQARAARFGSFRQAVRGTGAGTDSGGGPPSPAGPQGSSPVPDGTDSDRSLHSHAYPEGDTTS